MRRCVVEWRQLLQLVSSTSRIKTHDDHAPFGSRDRLVPFRGLAEHQAGNPEPGRLPLNTPGISDDGGCMELQRERRSVALGLDDPDIRPTADPGLLHRTARSRVQGKHDRSVRCGRVGEDPGPGGHGRRLAILLAMDRREEVAARAELQPEASRDRLEHGGVPHLGGDTSGEILHQVTDHDDAVHHALGPQVRDGRRGGGE